MLDSDFEFYVDILLRRTTNDNSLNPRLNDIQDQLWKLLERTVIPVMNVIEKKLQFYSIMSCISLK